MGNALSWSSRQPRDGQGRSQAAVVEGPITSGAEVIMRAVRSRGVAALVSVSAVLSRAAFAVKMQQASWPDTQNQGPPVDPSSIPGMYHLSHLVAQLNQAPHQRPDGQMILLRA